MFKLEMDVNGLNYRQMSEALRILADGLLECHPEQGDNGTVVVDGQTCGTWRIE